MKIVWSIAGSDSGGGAGIQADLNTFNDFNAHGCTVITALTAQNTQGVSHIQAASLENLNAQLSSLKKDLTPAAIKLGMLYTPEIIICIADYLRDMQVPIIADPVLVSTSQDKLYAHDLIAAYQRHIFPIATLITPNIHEAQCLANVSIQSHADMEQAAIKLLSLGAKAVLIKGGDLNEGELCSDLYADSKQQFWINLPRIASAHTHGTGCTLSAAIAASVAQDWSLYDAMVLAKAYVHAGLAQPRIVGRGKNPVGHLGLNHLNHHFPWITKTPQSLPPPFKKLSHPIGRYPIVDNLRDLTALCSKGISMIQLRIKNPGPDFETICDEALSITQDYGVALIINDYLDCFVGNTLLAMTGRHLGQEDLHLLRSDTLTSGVVLGISAHNLYELAKAYAHHPSYLAIGPIYPTKSKQLNYQPIGLDRLKMIVSLSPLPLVAIGGIDYEQIPETLALGCSGVAFIHAAKDLLHDGRYDRHLTLPHFSLESQQKLFGARVVCIGAGGLAAGFLPYLAAAGIGMLTVIDHDKISYSNLQRQILFQEKDIGQFKVDVAARYLTALNTTININTHRIKLTIDNAADLLNGHDLIIDGTDNFDSHYLINDLARYLKIPLISASVYRDQGQLFNIVSHSGCYRCLFPRAPSLNEQPNCNTAGVLGTTPGILGLMQAQLAIAVLSDQFKSQNSFCRTINMQNWKIKTMQLNPAQDCPVCQTPLSFNTIRSLHMKATIDTISAQILKDMLDADIPVNLLDVRENHEREEFNIGGDHIPIQELPERINELDDSLTYIVYCRSGGRSSMACEFLQKQGFKVKNLVGGTLAWQGL